MKHLVPNVKCVLWSVLLYLKFFIFMVTSLKFLASFVSSNGCHIYNLLFVKQQFLVTHTIRQTKIGLRTHLLSKCCVHSKTACRKSITCLSVGLLQIGQTFSVSCKTVYRWFTTNCCFMSDISPSKILELCRAL